MGMAGPAALPISPDEVSYLVATAARAPSLHNSQPWRFRARGNVIELHADHGRLLRLTDPGGREMLISCGAALYGLRLGLRKLGYLAAVQMLPDPAEPGLLALVQPTGRAPITARERELLAAVPHRHTHRGPFTPARVSARLLGGLGRDAVAEGADLLLIEQPDRLGLLAELTARADRTQQADPAIQAELGRWTRPAESPVRDGIPAQAWAAPSAGPERDRLPQRDFGGAGLLPAGGSAPSATAVLTTQDDAPADWLRAGQALHRLLLHAATRWVFASLHSQALELPPLRAEIQAGLALDGVPQMLMQFGRADTAPATARRPAGELIDPQR